MNHADLFDRALAFAAEHHAGQVDKAGHPYILHPVAVAAALAGDGPVTMAVALLHDVVEDTEVTIEEIEERFGPTVAGPVALLTKPDGDVDYGEYLDRIIEDPIATVVKLADMRHNLGRVDQLDDAAVVTRLRRKYEPRIERLEVAVRARTS